MKQAVPAVKSSFMAHGMHDVLLKSPASWRLGRPEQKAGHILSQVFCPGRSFRLDEAM